MTKVESPREVFATVPYTNICSDSKRGRCVTPWFLLQLLVPSWLIIQLWRLEHRALGLRSRVYGKVLWFGTASVFYFYSVLISQSRN